MANDMTHEAKRDWLIVRRGYYYRPKRSGYTALKAQAGRYTEAEAMSEAAIEPSIMQAVHESEARDNTESAPVAYYVEGLPPSDTKQNWIGESADGRQWGLYYRADDPAWYAFGVQADNMPILHRLVEENANFIVKSHLSPVQP